MVLDLGGPLQKQSFAVVVFDQFRQLWSTREVRVSLWPVVNFIGPATATMARSRSRSPRSNLQIADQKIVFIGTSTRFDLGQKYCGVNNGLFKCKERVKELGGEVVGTVASGRKIIPKDEKIIERADLVVKMSNYADVDLQKAEAASSETFRTPFCVRMRHLAIFLFSP